MITRKIGKLLRGNASRAQIATATGRLREELGRQLEGRLGAKAMKMPAAILTAYLSPAAAVETIEGSHHDIEEPKESRRYKPGGPRSDSGSRAKTVLVTSHSVCRR